MPATHDAQALMPDAARRQRATSAAPQPTAERPATAPASPQALLAGAQERGPGLAQQRQAAVQRLQQTLGNRATRRLLQRRAAPPTPGQSPAHAARAVQRYSVASLKSTKPIAWSQETVSAKKSAAGVSGGVYFLTSTGGMLVIKPEVGGMHPPEQTKFADQFLEKGMGIAAPTSKIVPADSAEGQDIQQAILATLVPPADQDPAVFRQAVTDDLADTTFYKVMNPFQGETISRMAAGADDRAKVDALVNRLHQEKIMHGIGRLMAADAFMQNADRMSLTNMNLGNIMLAHDAAKIYTLDTEALLPELKDTMNPREIHQKLSGGFDLIDGVFDHADAIFGGFLATITNFIPKTTTFDGPQHFTATFNRAQALAMVKEGIKKAVATFRAMGSTTGDLKKASQTLHMPRPKGVSDRTNWATLKINQFYTDLRAQGVDAAMAAKFAQELAQFRLDRAKITSKTARASASKDFDKEIKNRVKLTLLNQ